MSETASASGNLGLRVLAAAEIARGLLIGGSYLVRQRLIDRLETHSGDSGALLAQLKRVGELSRLGYYAVAALATVALVMVLIDRPKDHGRRFAIAALVMMGVALSATAYGRILDGRAEAQQATIAARVWVWIVQGQAGEAAVILALLAFAIPAKRKLPAIAAGATISLVSLALDFAIERSKGPASGLITTEVALLAVLHVGLGVVALQLSSVASRSVESQETAGAGPLSRIGALGLRMIGWAMLARIGGGLLIQGLMVYALTEKDYAGAGSYSVLAGVVAIGAGALCLAGLIAQLRAPSTLRSGTGVAIALAALGIDLVLEASAASAASDLFDMVAGAQHATSFWGMPSFSKIEELQATLRTDARLGLLLGVAATVAMAASLRTTAKAVGDEAQASRAVTAMVLASIGAAVAAGLALLVETPKMGELVIVLAPVLLCLGIALIVNWCRLIFGLASALDRSAAS